MADITKDLFRRSATVMKRRDLVRLADLERAAAGESIAEIDLRRLNVDPADGLMAAAAAGLLKGGRDKASPSHIP